MALTDEERSRLADIVRLQPTKNGELQDAWGLESGSEVHQYLQNHLKEYYYRDDDSLIRSTAEANDLVDVEPAIEADAVARGAAPETIRVPELEAQVFEVVAGPDERSQSVVSVLNALREAYDIDPEVDLVRRALRSLERKNVVEVVYRTVPTFKLAVERDSITVEVTE
jgi:2-C-methyl-D-erythritol 4-phosphate cytidylyltransferase